MNCIALLTVLLWSGGGGSCSEEDQFMKQVVDLVRRVKMPESKIQSVSGLLHILQTTFSGRWPESEVSLIGSMSYGIVMAYSDLDCTINMPDDNTNFESQLKAVAEAKTLLQQRQDFKNFITWTNLTVPVLCCDHTSTKLNIDISFNTHAERQRSRLIKYYMTLPDRRAYYLAFIVKYWSKISSALGKPLVRNYGVFLLVIFYLQQRKVLPSIASLQNNMTPHMIDRWNFAFDEKVYETQNSDSLSSLVLGFFKYYSEFDFDNYIISPHAGYPIAKSALEDLGAVPAEFALYKENVKSNMSQPLRITKGVMLQDAFVLNQCLNKTIDRLEIGDIFKDASRNFRQDKRKFLKYLLGERSFVLSAVKKKRASRIPK